MTKRDTEARERLIEAATQLIREQGDGANITTRDIAARAGVGVGLVNYHFQTKEQLLDLCTQKIIGLVIDGFDGLYQSLHMAPAEKLKFLLKENFRFLLANPGISRMSILHDINSPGVTDNTTQTLSAYLPVVREVCGGRADESEVRILTHAMISTLQISYLRGSAFVVTSGCDLRNTAHRDLFVDTLVDRLFHAYQKEVSGT